MHATCIGSPCICRATSRSRRTSLPRPSLAPGPFASGSGRQRRGYLLMIARNLCAMPAAGRSSPAVRRGRRVRPGADLRLGAGRRPSGRAARAPPAARTGSRSPADSHVEGCRTTRSDWLGSRPRPSVRVHRRASLNAACAENTNDCDPRRHHRSVARLRVRDASADTARWSTRSCAPIRSSRGDHRKALIPDAARAPPT